MADAGKDKKDLFSRLKAIIVDFFGDESKKSPKKAPKKEKKQVKPKTARKKPPKKKVEKELFEYKGKSLTIPDYVVYTCVECGEAIVDQDTLRNSGKILKNYFAI